MFPASRVLSDDAPRAPYLPSHAGGEQPIKGLHFGQRKLLLSEIEFLSHVVPSPASTPSLCVYAGAANGSHLPLLFQLFPSIKWILIDPAPFSSSVHQFLEPEPSHSAPPMKLRRLEAGTVLRSVSAPILQLRNEPCTDELCEELWQEYRETFTIYLISDIRSGNPESGSNKEATAMIMRDNAWQESWARKLHAAAAMLKFHPPYPPRADDPSDDSPTHVRYLRGCCLFGVWSPRSSTEVRLVAFGPFEGQSTASREYDCKCFEEQLYYYNTTTRYAKDVAAERLILQHYLTVTQGCPADDSAVDALSSRMSQFLGFPFFVPLSPDFTEDDARLCGLLYDARRENLFHSLRGVPTAAVREACRTGDKSKIPASFWEVATAKRLAAFYSTCPPQSKAL